ncbi:DUF1593-domain-containing protein [Pyrenochaeta sp. DS3sAY3a]|nr:DUF1593-domain-containing protein [Pyrenochaeta sp. DS3sAY3a]
MVDQSSLQVCRTKPRILVLTDIRNEPDDAESLVRFLLYTNEFDTRGIVACTSTHMKYAVHPEDIEAIVTAYGDVVDNLNNHVHPDNQYSAANYLHSIIRSGPALYGKEALNDGVPLSEGAALLIEQVNESEDPLWILCWGGTNVVAQALQHIQKAQSPSDFAHFRSKMRMYTISDQDDTGLWIRQRFPDIFYICSVHGWKEYVNATWFAISGELSRDFDTGGPDSTKVSRSWLKEHIQIGPLGKLYPTYPFIMEGDTPTFLYLIQNGLGSPEHPEWGSWGGRYTLVDLSGESKHYADATDEVIGKSGKMYSSNHATIWRWRDHFQDNFAARMQWTLTNDRNKANHAPVVIVNGSSSSPEPLLIEAEANTEIILDASQSYDPDGDELSFQWIHYKEVTQAQAHVHWELPRIGVQSLDKRDRRVKIRLPPPEVSAVNKVTGTALQKGMVHHFILQVTDKGWPSLTTYKRIVVQTTNNQLVGGGKAYESVTASMGILHS